MQAIATNVRLVSIMLKSHVRNFPGIVSVPFRTYEPTVIGLVHRPEPTPALEALFEVALEQFARPSQ